MECIRVENEGPSGVNDHTTAEATNNVKPVKELIAAEGLDAPIDCFHSIFGSDSSESDWQKDTVCDTVEEDPEWDKFSLKDKITITDLKEEHLKLDCGFSITRYQKYGPSIDCAFKAEQVFDKSSARKRLKCPNCYFLTDNRGNLKQHMKIHLKPNECILYHCEFCNFKTKYKNSIKGHVLRHQRTKGKKGQKKHKK